MSNFLEKVRTETQLDQEHGPFCVASGSACKFMASTKVIQPFIIVKMQTDVENRPGIACSWK